jgi:triosephosphate isomerase
MKKLIAGNWKMNGTLGSARTLIEGIVDGLQALPSLTDKCDFVVCPPFVHMTVVKSVIEHNHGPIDLGAQNCADLPGGAYTGEVSAEMLKDFACHYVILGHSERRQLAAETDAQVRAKAELAHEAGLKAIICVGETAEQRSVGMETEVVESQLFGSIPPGATAENTVIAYEPVWAIGTGKVATVDDVAAMHQFIRDKVKEKVANSGQMRILYGGSVKPDNALALFAVPNVNGALIGGASLDAKQYLAIAQAAA